MIELVKKDKPKGIWVGGMKDGDVGVIVAWTTDRYINYVIQRHHNGLIAIGRRETWSCIWSGDRCVLSSNFRVRLLEKGETLIVT